MTIIATLPITKPTKVLPVLAVNARALVWARPPARLITDPLSVAITRSRRLWFRLDSCDDYQEPEQRCELRADNKEIVDQTMYQRSNNRGRHADVNSRQCPVVHLQSLKVHLPARPYAHCGQ